MQEKEPTYNESLRVIHEMIQLAKHRITQDGFHFLWWGSLVIAASLTQYLLLAGTRAMHSNWVWMLMPLVGVPVVFIYEARKRKQPKAPTRFDRIYGWLWLGFGITLMVTIFVSVSFGINPIAFILSLIGLATFVSAAIYRFVPLYMGAGVFWTAAVTCTFINYRDQLLLNALAIFLGYIVPGILLWKNYKNQDDV